MQEQLPTKGFIPWLLGLTQTAVIIYPTENLGQMQDSCFLTGERGILAPLIMALITPLPPVILVTPRTLFIFQ